MSILYFLFTFFLIVTVHEWGHFQTARSLKVAIDGFSIGMGPKILSWKSKRSGIHYKLSALPLGGYVAFTTKESVEVSNRLGSGLELFDTVSRWKRSAIVAAGPAMNFVFAFILLVIVSMVGKQVVVPNLIGVSPDSRAQKAGLMAGDTIVSVEGHMVDSTSDFMSMILSQVGNDSVLMEVERRGNTQAIQFDMSGITLSRETINSTISELGLMFPSVISMRVEEVTEGSAAQIAGILAGDKIVSLNGKSVYYAADFIQELNEYEGNQVVEVMRDGKTMSFNIVPILNESVGRKMIGIRFASYSQDSELFVSKAVPLTEATMKAASQTWAYATMSYTFVEKLFKQDIAFNMLSGPVGIAKATERAANIGFVTLFSFIALLSVNIGVLNLLPLPGLDGGHLATYAVEGTMRKELNKTAKEWAMRISFAFIVIVMISAIYIDFLYN